MTRILLSGPFEKFVEASSVTVMLRGIIENLFRPERLERLSEENAVTQYTRTLPFSTVVMETTLPRPNTEFWKLAEKPPLRCPIRR